MVVTVLFRNLVSEYTVKPKEIYPNASHDRTHNRVVTEHYLSQKREGKIWTKPKGNIETGKEVGYARERY